MTDVPFWQPLGLLLVAIATLVFTCRRPRLDQRHDGVRASADAMSLALIDLRDVVLSARTTPDPGPVRTALRKVDAVFRCHGGRLPAGLMHLPRSVTSAVTNYVGGTVTPYDPRLWEFPREQHHDFYWEIALEYIQHASRAVNRWRDRPHFRTHRLCRYEEYRADDDPYRRSR